MQKIKTEKLFSKAPANVQIQTNREEISTGVPSKSSICKVQRLKATVGINTEKNSAVKQKCPVWVEL